MLVDKEKKGPVGRGRASSLGISPNAHSYDLPLVWRVLSQVRNPLTLCWPPFLSIRSNCKAQSTFETLCNSLQTASSGILLASILRHQTILPLPIQTIQAHHPTPTLYQSSVVVRTRFNALQRGVLSFASCFFHLDPCLSRPRSTALPRTRWLRVKARSYHCTIAT